MPAVEGQYRVVYDDFSGGDYGSQDGSKVPLNSFSALNMIVTDDNCLIPRPGLSNHTPTGMPNGKVVAMAPTSTPTRDMLIIVGNKVYTYNKNDGTNFNEIGTLAVTPTLAIYPKQSTTEFYITVPGDKCYKLDPVTNTIDPYDTSPGGTEVELVGQRLVVAGADAVYRIQFSDPADFDSWPAENFVDIGDFWQITAMRSQRNYFIVMKREGYYVFSGAPGTSAAAVRLVSADRGPLHPGQAVVDLSDMIHVVSAFRNQPHQFDSVNVTGALSQKFLNKDVRDGETPELPLVFGVAESQGDQTPSSVLFAQGDGENKALLNHNGAWTRHEFSVDITGMVRGGETGDFYLTDGGDTGTPGNIYAVQFTESRPAFTTDTFSQPGDDSDVPVDASITLPEIQVPASRRTTAATDIAVRQVIVDFWKYNTGASEDNQIDIAIDAQGRFPVGTGDASTDTYSWTEAGTEAGLTIGDVKRERLVHGFKSARAMSAAVSLRNIKGVKIKQITVAYDVFETRPAS